MSSPLKEVEEYIHNAYLQNYEALTEELKWSPDGEPYTVDGSKLQCLNAILEFNLDECYIGKSALEKAGNGLFAKNDLLEGQVITFYPGDVSSYIPNNDASKPGHISLESYSQRFKNQFEKTMEKEREKDTILNEYTYDVEENYRITGCPYFTDNANYMGHFINDGAKLDVEGFDESYLTSSSLKSNCIFYHIKVLLVAIIATKYIKKGDEFYIKYGTEYWKSYNKRDQADRSVTTSPPPQSGDSKSLE